MSTLVRLRHASVACRVHAHTVLQRRPLTAPTVTPVAFAKLDGGGQLAQITLQNPRANLFDHRSLQALDAAMDAVESSDVRGLVLRSAVPGFFSAGFNLPALHRVDRSGFEGLWVLGKRVFRRIYALPVPSVAAIDGHALGLGCVMAMACQRRFMVTADRPALIGLNEVAVGMPVPEWLATRFRDLTSNAAAEALLPSGATLSPERAHAIGLVDQVFASGDAMHAAIQAEFQQTKVSSFAQQQTIRGLRRQFLDYFDACFDQDTEQFWHAISSAETQTAIGQALAQLKAKSKS
ncbi:hypothetical protein LPJ63_002507 [Coemansia sp. RSA 2711]|nr:hypothetical protein LPJ63_002507 [Coemansia sp. RSA 2711]